MAVYIKAIRTLRGETAERFIKKSEENLRRRATIDFSKEIENSKIILRNKKTVKYL